MFIQKTENIPNSLVKNNSVFNSVEWLALFNKENLNFYGIFNKNKELIGCFHTYNHKRGKIFNQLAPAPFTPTNSLLVKSQATNPAQVNSFNKKISKLLSGFLMEQKQSIITFFLPPHYNETQPFVWDGFEVMVRQTYQLNLTASQDVLLANMSTERRKNIKKAIAEGITTQLELQSENSIKLIKHTFQKYQLKVDNQILDKILTQFASKTNSICFVSYANTKPIATVFCIHDNQTAYYLFGGYDNANKHEGAGALAMWEAIKHAQQKGIKIFDFEGSMVPAIEKYFRGFGGKMVPYYGIKKASLLTKSVLKI